MLARLKDVFFPPVPSVVLAVDKLNGMIDFAHVVPEDGTIEVVGFTCRPPTTFRIRGTTELSREQIGTVTIYAEDCKGAFNLLDAAVARALRSLDGLWPSGPRQERTGNMETPATHLAPDDLHPPGADAIPNQNGQACSIGATRTGNVDVVTQLEEALRQAALDAIRDREAHPPSENVEKTYPVFIIRVKRPKAGQIYPLEFSSIE